MLDPSSHMHDPGLLTPPIPPHGMVPLLPSVDPVVVVACGTYAAYAVLVIPLPPLWSLWFWWSCPCGCAPLWTPWLLWSCCASGCPPLREATVLSTVQTARRSGQLSLSTLRHRGAGSPHTRTLSRGHHALVVGHVTALAGNSKLHPVVSMLFW